MTLEVDEDFDFFVPSSWVPKPVAQNIVHDDVQCFLATNHADEASGGEACLTTHHANKNSENEYNPATQPAYVVILEESPLGTQPSTEYPSQPSTQHPDNQNQPKTQYQLETQQDEATMDRSPLVIQHQHWDPDIYEFSQAAWEPGPVAQYTYLDQTSTQPPDQLRTKSPDNEHHPEIPHVDGVTGHENFLRTQHQYWCSKYYDFDSTAWRPMPWFTYLDQPWVHYPDRSWIEYPWEVLAQTPFLPWTPHAYQSFTQNELDFRTQWFTTTGLYQVVEENKVQILDGGTWRDIGLFEHVSAVHWWRLNIEDGLGEELATVSEDATIDDDNSASIDSGPATDGISSPNWSISAWGTPPAIGADAA